MSNITRREFIKSSTAMSLSAAMFLAGCGSSSSTTSSVEPIKANPNATKDKALVYLMLNGGNDSFNMLVPTSTAAYNEYNSTRSNLAIDRNRLLALNNFTDKNNKTFGLHPSMPKVQALFNSNDPKKNLSFIANVGTLVQPTTKAQFQANSVKLPLGLMSHSDQRKHWQTNQADIRSNIGLFGKFADKFQAGKQDSQISMNISLGGTNICQNGVNSTEYAISEGGSEGLIVNDVSNPLNDALKKSFDSIIQKSYANSFEKTYMNTIKDAQSHHETFKARTDSINITTSFPEENSLTTYKDTANNIEETKYSGIDKKIAQQFKMIAKAIKASDTLGMNKQTFYIDYYGWDHHDEVLNNHARMLSVIDNALASFYDSLIELGIEDKVVTVVGSDFGRTLTSNGNGTDHAWGGNAIVMGKDIKGGQIFGEYPSLDLNNNPLDIGGGVLIPTTSTDELFAELAYWFGIEKTDLNSYLPNLKNFYTASNLANPIGFIS